MDYSWIAYDPRLDLSDTSNATALQEKARTLHLHPLVTNDALLTPSGKLFWAVDSRLWPHTD
ncbi:hypothetical protein Dda_0171 [Drechslerella dactyloides]|uniref:Uncharacterized protein n=1 Tax=Drechslerella dactyloides TaxID=74499 RepID=A0AAD6J593_DREDA|nr:hypothetical protein Dda_0171 [Drechslerella dactyloides]